MEFIFDHDLHIHSYISPCAPKEAREQQTVERILRYADENNLNEIKRLIEFGVQIVDSAKSTIDSELSGKKVVLTGSLNDFSRDQASEIIRKLGGETVTKGNPLGSPNV